MPAQRPIIPPRMYPQPPPSNLPRLFLGMIRLFSWIGGGTVALLSIYYRYLLPRITLTSAARHSLKGHQLMLMTKLTSSLSELKASQTESYSVLPRTQPYNEPVAFSGCHSVSEVLEYLEAQKLEVHDVPPVTFLRCGIETLAKDAADANPTTEELFMHLEEKISWFASDDGLVYEEKLWDTLNACPLFTTATTTAVGGENGIEIKTVRWSYTPPCPPPPPRLIESLDNLAAMLPKDSMATEKPFQRTLQVLSDFTGYISTQVYLPYRPSLTGGFGISGNGPINTVEEELKREIRALKGLVLNRRSFMATIPKVNGRALSPVGK